MRKAAKSMRAVAEDDLDAVLARLGMADSLQRGELKCASCGAAVTRESIQALLPKQGRILAVCDRPGCLAKLSEGRR